MAKVTLKGTGHLNGVVIINKTFEMDAQQGKAFVGAKKNEVIQAFLAVHYPGVKIDPKKIGVVVTP